jgi:GNAT superfamily N-acetyltransferase
MPQILETHRDNFMISTDHALLDHDAIAELLKHSYWASGRPRERLERALANSLVFGLYDGSRQIGLARIVSDYAVFAYLCDVFIHEDYRAHGLGKWLMQTIHSHPDLQGLRRWTLATRDAHGLYQQFGWKPLDHPDSWMEILNPNPGEGRD